MRSPGWTSERSTRGVALYWAVELCGRETTACAHGRIRRGLGALVRRGCRCDADVDGGGRNRCRRARSGGRATLGGLDLRVQLGDLVALCRDLLVERGAKRGEPLLGPQRDGTRGL